MRLSARFASLTHAPGRAQHVLVLVGLVAAAALFVDLRLGTLAVVLWVGLASGHPFARYFLRWIAETVFALGLCLFLTRLLMLFVSFGPGSGMKPIGLTFALPFVSALLSYCCQRTLGQDDLWTWSEFPSSETRVF